MGIQIEERTLIAILGDSYRDYQKRVSQIIPMPPKSENPSEAGALEAGAPS